MKRFRVSLTTVQNDRGVHRLEHVTRSLEFGFAAPVRWKFLFYLDVTRYSRWDVFEIFGFL